MVTAGKLIEVILKLKKLTSKIPSHKGDAKLLAELDDSLQDLQDLPSDHRLIRQEFTVIMDMLFILIMMAQMALGPDNSEVMEIDREMSSLRPL